MSSKKIGALLVGALFGFCSCVDDTYDLSKKELSLDMKIEGNRIALPLGSLRPIVLDSILDVSSIPVLEADTVTHTYSLSFDSSMVISVPKEDLDVLKEVSKLSADIDPIAIPLEEIRFTLPSFDTLVSMPLEEVELKDVTLDPINEEVVLALDEIKIDPIAISGEERPVKFEIPEVKWAPVTIPGTEQPVSFNVESVEVNGVTSDPVGTDFTLGVDPIDLDKIDAPVFKSEMKKNVGEDNSALKVALSMGDDQRIKDPLNATFNNTITSEGEMKVHFEYTLPKEIKHFDAVEVGKDAKGALFEFEVNNPSLLAGSGLSRTIGFTATFPDNYELALFEDDNKKYYDLKGNTISVSGMPANGTTTTIHFYLKQIKHLSKYCEDRGGKGNVLLFDDLVKYTVDYTVKGGVSIPAGTKVGDLRERLSYSVKLDAEFDVREAYGTTNPVEINFEEQQLDFSFPLKDLKYLKRINSVVLNPEVSKLVFTTSMTSEEGKQGFGKFDIDKDSKIMLSFPKEFVFADDKVELPDSVKRVSGTNDFVILSVEALKNKEWILPISRVNINKDVNLADGSLNLDAKATVKAISKDGAVNVLTIGGQNELALRASTKELCGNRQVMLQASSIKLDIQDVTGQTTPIDVAFDNESMDFNFSVEGEFENIRKVDFVEFDADKKIKIISTLAGDKNFDKINFEEGSFLAIRFPEQYKFNIQKSTLTFNDSLHAFVIDDLSKLKNGMWELALDRVDINEEVTGNTFGVNATIEVMAVNKRGEEGVFYVDGGDEFSLKELEQCFGKYDLAFKLLNSPVEVTNMQVNTNPIDVDFANQSVTQQIKLDSLNYVTHIGSIDLKEGSNKLLFRTGLKGGGLGRFNLAVNSVIDFVFPEEFKLDPVKSVIPTNGAKFIDSTHIQIFGLEALDAPFDWQLAVKRIAINEAISGAFEKELTIQIVASSAQGKADDKLTIAAIDRLTLAEVQAAGGEREMEISVQPCSIEVADVQASIDDIDFEFAGQSFEFPINIKDLELVKEIKYISFDKQANKIALNISLDGTLEPFDLADNSVVKIALPKEFVLDQKESKFGGLEYKSEENAIYIHKIKDIKDAQLLLVLDRIAINKVIEDNMFDWKGAISVTAVNTVTGEEGKLVIGGRKNLHLSEVQDVMSDKIVKFNVPAVQLRIDEAVIVSNTVKADIEETISIPIDEGFSVAIDRVDSIGFVEPVPMALKIKTTGLDDIDGLVNIAANVTLPPVFTLSSSDDKVTVTEDGIQINVQHNFKESNTIQVDLIVENLDFTGLEGGYLELLPTEDGGRKLQYDGEAGISGTVSMDGVELSSKLLDEGISMGISFEMGEIVLKEFTGIYNDAIDPIVESFELGIDDGFAELENNGLKLANTKPELMITLYNSIGVPVDVDLSIIGRDKNGDAMPNATVNPGKMLRVKPAYLDAQGNLVADTTRWLFTSNEVAQIPGYETVVVKTLDSLLNNLPYSIDFALTPEIVTKDVVHHVDLSKLELGGRYSLSMPFDLQFAQSIPLDLGEEVRSLTKENNLALANPQLMIGFHNPIAQDLSFDLSIVGKDANDQPIGTASLVFDEPFVLAAGQRNADGTITPTPTRWLFAVSDSITKEGYDTKVAPALGTLLQEIPYNIDVALNAHFNTDLTTQIDYNNNLDLELELGVLVPLQFTDIQLNYTDTLSEIKFNIEETLLDLDLGLSNIGLAINMNLKNTMPLGLKLDLIPLDVDGNVIEDIEIGSIEIPAGDGREIGTGEGIEGTPVELSIRCASASAMSALDKISFRLDVASGNGDNALSGAQGLLISDIVLDIMCDVEMDLGK